MANWVNERHPLLNAHPRPTSVAGPWTLFNTYNQHHLPIGSWTSTMSTDADVLHIDRPTLDAGPSIMSSGVVMIAIECSNNSSIAHLLTYHLQLYNSSTLFINCTFTISHRMLDPHLCSPL
jgi:hypothetical protein